MDPRERMTAAVERTPMSARARGLLFALSAGLVLSTNGLLLRFVEAADQWQVIVFRSGSLGVTVLLVLALRYRLRLFGVFRSLGWTGLLAGLILGISYPSYVLSLLNTTVANALFLMSTSPVIAAVLGLIFLGEAVRGTTWLAIFGTVVGVLIMVYDGLDGGGMPGNAVALNYPSTTEIYTLLARRNRDIDMMPALAIGGFIGSGIGALGASSFALTPHDLGLCLFMGAVQLTLGFTLITLAAQRAPIAEVNLVAMIEMVAGPVIVWLGVGELPSDLTILGGAIVLLSVGGLAVSGMVEAGLAARPRKAPRIVQGAAARTRRSGRTSARSKGADGGDFAAVFRDVEALEAVQPVRAPVVPALLPPLPAAVAEDATLTGLWREEEVAPPAAARAVQAERPRGPAINVSVERHLQIALEPMLRAWVEANIRRLVTPMLRREIRALVRKAEWTERK